jgi:hypothetical protein
VDDLTIVAPTIGQIDQIKRQLHANFEMTDLGEVSWLLGLDIQRARQSRTISIGQAAFIDTILARFSVAATWTWNVSSRLGGVDLSRVKSS